MQAYSKNEEEGGFFLLLLFLGLYKCSPPPGCRHSQSQSPWVGGWWGNGGPAGLSRPLTPCCLPLWGLRGCLRIYFHFVIISF